MEHPTVAAPGGEAAARPAPHPNYVGVWILLAVLTLVEVGITFIGLSKTFTVVALIVLALWKALLVALYYMHLRYEPRRLWWLVMSPLPLAIILVVAVLTEF